MYTEPKTDIATIEAAMNICHVSADGNVKINNEDTVNDIKIF
jgi:hypothetical protein